MDETRPWTVYLLECTGGVLYCGVTNDLAKRLRNHIEGKGARFTRSRPPKAVAAFVLVSDKSAALKLEYAVKQKPRSQKIAFLQSMAFGCHMCDGLASSVAPVVRNEDLAEASPGDPPAAKKRRRGSSMP